MRVCRPAPLRSCAAQLDIYPGYIQSIIQEIAADAEFRACIVFRHPFLSDDQKDGSWKKQTSGKPGRFVLLVLVMAAQRNAASTEEHLCRAVAKNDVGNLVHEIASGPCCRMCWVVHNHRFAPVCDGECGPGVRVFAQ